MFARAFVILAVLSLLWCLILAASPGLYVSRNTYIHTGITEWQFKKTVNVVWCYSLFMSQGIIVYFKTFCLYILCSVGYIIDFSYRFQVSFITNIFLLTSGLLLPLLEIFSNREVPVQGSYLNLFFGEQYDYCLWNIIWCSAFLRWADFPTES